MPNLCYFEKEMTTRSIRVHHILSAMALMLVSLFALWWFQPGHIPNNFTGWLRLVDVALFGLVSYVIWHPIVMAVFSWSVVSNIKHHSSPKPEKGHKVAFITTFVPASESIELLHKCLPAMVGSHYEHDTWLLDEGNDSRVKAICKQYGVKHFSRADMPHYNSHEGKFAKKTKGGNHNSWYDSHGQEYDFVAQIDTDFVPSKHFLTKTLGYFKDPKIAFVGTPQVYGNTEDSLIARGAAEQTYSFYGPILRGFHGMEMNMLIGANHVIRVKALEDVDHYSAHITEDLLTGMKLHSKGWKSTYVSETLAIGEGPSTWQAYFSQQMRWAYGCMHILRHHSFKLFKTMSWRQKLYYFMLQQHYFSGLVMALGSIGLLLYFFIGVNTADVDFISFLAIYIPVMCVVGLMALWMQRFHVRPKDERGILWAGKIISAAAWPIFFIAFLGVISGKKLTYRVTPKGDDKVVNEDSIRLFTPHLLIGLMALIGLVSALFTDRTSIIMIYWAIVTAATMLFVPFAQPLLNILFKVYDYTTIRLEAINNRYRVVEFRAPTRGLLPDGPDVSEKYSYINRQYWLIMGFSLVSFLLVTASIIRFISANPALWVLFGFLSLTVVYYVVSFVVDIATKGFNVNEHKRIVGNWRPRRYPSVDIFLPTAGEDIQVLSNTWAGVQEVISHYKGKAIAYCLDDGDRDEVKTLAKQYGFKYEVRPNRGQHKKAGNLRHGFSVSSGDFIVIFDADFRPRFDFLDELVPHMEANPKLGIVQSPQYFDVHTGQNWVERGAGAVQELFYRFTQVCRQEYESAICVGSNALYRRRALNDIGGTALIEHSEDVHTGFNLRAHNWDLRYVPIVLAKGLSPDALPAFFKQQYRWCMGSLSLMTSNKFWQTDLGIRPRLSYISGFLYYLHTALEVLFTPVIPLYLLLFAPQSVKVEYLIFILPAFVFSWVIYPLWHKNIYGIEAWSIRNAYGWAHLSALYDALTRRSMSWQPTGAVKGRDYRYITFRICQTLFNFIPGLAWVALAGWHVAVATDPAFVFMFISGGLYLAITAKVTFYTTKPMYFRKRTHKNSLLAPDIRSTSKEAT